MKTRIDALTDKVVVKELNKKEETTKGGIILPEIAANSSKTRIGVVDTVGPDVKSKLEKGDVVLFSHIGGQQFLISGESWRVLIEGEIFGIIKEVSE